VTAGEIRGSAAGHVGQAKYSTVQDSRPQCKLLQGCSKYNKLGPSLPGGSKIVKDQPFAITAGESNSLKPDGDLSMMAERKERE
jgi:hypothetical protein